MSIDNNYYKISSDTDLMYHTEVVVVSESERNHRDVPNWETFVNDVLNLIGNSLEIRNYYIDKINQTWNKIDTGPDFMGPWN